MNAPYVITRYDNFSVILDECPEAEALFAEYGLHCANCFLGEDTVERGAAMHGMSEDDMLEMIDDINTELEHIWRKKHDSLLDIAQE